jgi:O-antigen ligase
VSERAALICTTTASLLAGLAVGVLPGRWDVVVGLVGLVVVVTVTAGLLRPPEAKRASRLPLTARQVLALASLYLVLINTLTLRQRSSSALAEDPLDLAGTLRVTCLGGAVAFACAAMLLHRLSLRQIPVAGWSYLLYVLVVPLGIANAVSPGLVLFKWAELVAFVLVWLALLSAFEEDLKVPIRHVGIFVGAVMTSIVAGILLFGDEALTPKHAFIPVQLVGVVPSTSANEVGALGVLAIVYGLGRARISPGLVSAGAALLLAAQYRTGYIAALAVVVVFLVLRKQASARVVLVGLAVLLPLAITTSTFQQAWLRGDQPQVVSSLTGRTGWWAAAVEATERSPLTGLGLSSGVRYEIFPDGVFSHVSTIHSTWIEAYTGTGLIGATLIAAALGLGWWSAWRRARWDGYLFPVLLMTMLLVRSLTATTIELGGTQLLLFLLAVSASKLRPPRAKDLALLPLAGDGERGESAPVAAGRRRSPA